MIGGQRGARGYVLVEMITALTLFSLAGSTLYNGYREGLYSYRRLEQSARVFNAPKLLFIRLERDLRNMTHLPGEPFRGQAREIQFPAVLTEMDGKVSRERLVIIRYYFREGELIREEMEKVPGLLKPRPRRKVMVSGLETAEFRFSYTDEQGDKVFEPLWIEDPYPGMPRAVQLKIIRGDFSAIKLVSIPQGVFASRKKEGSA